MSKEYNGDDNELILPPIINNVRQKELENNELNNSNEENNFNDNENPQTNENEIITDDNNKNLEIQEKKEKYKKEIEQLKQEIEEKNKILTELQNKDNPEYIIGDALTKYGFQNNSEQRIYVRNDTFDTDYEIIKVFSSYAD